MAQNTTKTPRKRPGPGKPFVKGDARINRGGRPKSFAHVIREETKDGAELVATALAIMRGQLVIRDSKVVDKHLVPVSTRSDHKCRLEAVRLLAEQGWGKPPQRIEVSTDLEGLSDAELLEQLGQALTSTPELRPVVEKLLGRKK